MGMPQCRNSGRCLRGAGPASLGPPLPEDEDRLAGTVASLPVVIWGIACPEDELFEGVVTSGNKVSLPVTTQGLPACGRTVPCRAAPHRAAPRRTMPRRAGPCRTVPHRAVPCRAVPGRAVPCRAVPCRAVRAVPGRAGPCRAVLCRAAPGRAVHPKDEARPLIGTNRAEDLPSLTPPQTSQHPTGQHLWDVGGRGLRDKSCLAAPTS